MCTVNLLVAQWLQKETAVVISPFDLEIKSPDAHNDLERRRYFVTWPYTNIAVMKCHKAFTIASLLSSLAT